MQGGEPRDYDDAPLRPSRIGSAAGTFVLPLVMAAYGARMALGACVAVLAVGALVCYRWAPETRHLGLGALDQVASEPEEPGSLALPVEGAP